MDIQKIEQLIEIVNGAEVSEICVESTGRKVRIKKGWVHKAAVPKPQAAAGEAKRPAEKPSAAPASHPPEPKEFLVTAPMVGIFHRLNGSVGAGTVIKAGQLVGSIESMKLMNDIKADVDGTVEEVLVEDGMPVEFGQTLLRLVCN